MGLHQTKKHLHSEGNCQQSKNIVYWLREDICSMIYNNQDMEAT